MPKVLRLNTAAIKADYMKHMSRALDEIAHGYFFSVVNQMQTSRGKSGVTVEGEDDENILMRRIIGDAWAVIDSWGTGSKMDTSNPALNDYLSSGLYNPARPNVPGAPITGRPAGEYTDIFGEQAHSSGALAGINLETLPGSPIQAQSPSGAFQDTDKWLIAEDTLREVSAKATREFFQGVFRNSAKYFKFS